MDTYKYGDRVRVTASALGVVDPAQPRVMLEDAIVNQGDLGVIVAADLPEGWLAVEPERFPGKFAPVHPSMIERAA